MTTKLTDLQRVLLSSAAMRPDGNLLPLPASIAGETARVMKTVSSLLKRGLVEQVDVTDPAQICNEGGERRVGVRITAAGHNAIGTAAEQTDTPFHASNGPDPSPERPTKAAQVLTLLRRTEGATLAELVEATGWLPHTTRAALTGLRKKGHTLDKSKRGETTCYRIVAGA